MGKTFASPEAFAREVAEMDRKLARDTAFKATREQAREAQKIAYRTAAGDLGGDPKFSGWRPWLKLEIKPTRRAGHVLHPTRQSAGPWTVAEIGRNQFVGPTPRESSIGRTGRRKRAGRRFRRWNGQTVGKETASKAVAAMERKLPPIASRAATKQMRRHFDVS